MCHGLDGKGNGTSAVTSEGGYIMPVPANFTESGSDFTNYGRYVWKVKEGVETTNMPPWKYALSDEEIFEVIYLHTGLLLGRRLQSKMGAVLYGCIRKGPERGK